MRCFERTYGRLENRDVAGALITSGHVRCCADDQMLLVALALGAAAVVAILSVG
jgi:hypothetical protein